MQQGEAGVSSMDVKERDRWFGLMSARLPNHPVEHRSDWSGCAQPKVLQLPGEERDGVGHY